MDGQASLQADILIAANHLGISAGQIAFSDRLEWIGCDDGQVMLRSAAIDRTSRRVTLYLDAMRSRWEAVDLQPKALALLADAIASLKDWNEEDHPRDEDGKFTFSGGGPSESDEGAYGGLVTSPSAATTVSGGEKPKLTDFEKDKIRLGSFKENKEQAERFVDQWSNTVKGTPAAFKEQFLGGVPASMSIQVNRAGDWHIEGNILDGDRSIGTYQRDLDIDGKTAESSYFALNSAVRSKNIGKQVLAGNIATYLKLGIEKVKVHANIDVGGYAWAKYGYVPTRSSWSELSDWILRRLGDTSGSGGSGYRPESWEEIGSNEQDNIRDRWMSDTRSEFIDSEIDNWRENGEALHIAKKDLAEGYDGTNTWAASAIADWRRENENVPYSYQQILAAINVTYDDEDYDGKADPEIEFDDAKLREPTDAPPKDQLTLPGFKPPDLASHLTETMRDEITGALVKAFNDRADSDEGDVEPPDYLADNVGEYQEDVWSSMDEADRYRWADRHGYIEKQETESDNEEPVQVEEGANQTLRQLATSSDPKAIWAIADSPQGKELLLNSDWQGVLNLKDKETMDRFNAYVGKAGKASAAAA